VLVGEATDVDSLLVEADQHQPDLVLIDWDLAGQPTDQLFATLHALDSQPKLVVLGSDAGMEELAMAAGADAFVSKANPPKQLLITLNTMRLELEERASSQP